MILREIGEHRDADLRAIEPMLGNADRRGLHHARTQALVNKLPQLLLQQHRVGRGHACAHQLIRGHAYPQRANQCAAAVRQHTALT